MAEKIKKTTTSSIKRKRFFQHFFTYLYMIILSVIILYPLAITFISAFKNANLQAFTLNFSGPWSLDNFKQLFSTTLYGTWYMNTLIISVMTMIVQVAAVTLAGYAYSRYNFAGKKWSLIFFLVVQMIPTMAALTAFFVLGLLVHGLNSFWYITLVYIGGGIPMNAYLMKGYFDTVPYDFDESAKLDGAGNFTIFWKIVFPLVKPMVAVQALWAFMGPFGDYMTSSYLLRAQNKWTVAVGLKSFISDAQNQQFALFAAGAILVALPICLLFLYLQRYFVSGLTAGGAKG
ncbi:sugar ABC transporter permease [Ligilactobacillus aviarius]|uniref:sugar ABC transporter permease n=1 Tax=Ligilactobacillus aviarius TaxID=1606 RepID=UPI00195E0055|nr:sugar ABC transporter permease [Ligilactobacillus aviarius]MBM6862957.1 sugar ABC transporter permease [Ligilactobacillus aviarius]